MSVVSAEAAKTVKASRAAAAAAHSHDTDASAANKAPANKAPVTVVDERNAARAQDGPAGRRRTRATAARAGAAAVPAAADAAAGAGGGHAADEALAAQEAMLELQAAVTGKSSRPDFAM